MKNIGLALIILGVIGLCYSYNMKTTVTTEAKYLGYGIEVPPMTVNNLGLIEDRRNALMLSGIVAIVGAILYAASSIQQSKTNSFQTTTFTNQTTSYVTERKCPYCAEPIRNEAVICRFCNRDVSEISKNQADVANISVQELAKYRNDPDKLMSLYGIKKDGNLYEYRGRYFERPYDAIAHAELQSMKDSLSKSIQELS